MGFSENRAKRALVATHYKGIQDAMEWLIAHSDDPSLDEPFQEPEGHKLGETSSADAGDATATPEEKTTQAEGDKPAVAKSLKCDDCGKLLKTPTDVEAHAARTSHQNFSESEEEIKPLTEEEKKAQLAKLQEKIKQRQAEKEEQEKQEALEKEKLRRKQGKEMTNIKQKMEMDEIKKLAEFKKREKMEDKLARQRVREQIARDKAERAAKFGKMSPSATTPTGGTPSAPSAAPQQEPATAPAAKKEYDEARIQIRLTDGSTLVQTFKADELLAAVRVYVEMNRKDGTGPFTFMTTFPRKVFSTEDMETPLKHLGLLPSAVLVTKPL